MTQQTATDTLFEELAHRENNGIDVTLLWRRTDNHLSVYVVDDRTGAVYEISVRPHQALDAFEHPFAYLSSDRTTMLAPSARVSGP
jgi:hypothetical protein